MSDGGPAGVDWDVRLRADCGRCVGLCCTALSFAKSSDFAFDKPAGEPCVNLQPDYRCVIHPVLRESGFKGCTVFDCFGAGQQVTQVTYGGASWRERPETAGEMFGVFTVVRQLHELLWYLTQAVELAPVGTARDDAGALREETEQLTRGTATALLELNVNGHRDRVNSVLGRVSDEVRGEAARPALSRSGKGRSGNGRSGNGRSGEDRSAKGRSGNGQSGTDRRKKGAPKIQPGADLIGASLRGADLRGANLRAAYLIAADLRDADLRLADLIGVDLRDADLSGADVSTSLFLTQSQLNSAKGDATTRLPAALTRPAHWT